MASSFVEWTGLTKLIHDLEETIPRRASADIATLTAVTGEDMLLRYQDNLAGGAPSTDDAPLPVGMRSGDLYDQAQLTLINQYAFELHNDSDHAGWIEFGTVNMAPRAPLGDVVRQIESEMDATLGEVMQGIIDG